MILLYIKNKILPIRGSRRAGSRTSAFSVYEPTFAFYLLALSGATIVLLSACSPKTGAKVQTEATTMPSDSLVVIDGNPEEEETFLEPEMNKEEVEKPLPEVLLEVKKTGCYGKCPEYEVRMYSNGHLIYQGYDQVLRLGKYEARIDPLRIYDIYKIADQYHFFQAADFYPEKGLMIRELPTTVTYLKREEMEKTITNNHSSPVGLRRFESFLDEWLETLLWIRITEEK